MKDLRETLEQLAREHPNVHRARGNSAPITERRLIDDMLVQVLGAAGCAGFSPRWFLRERTLVVILADASAYAAARFLTREVTKTLRDLGYPGGAQDVRFRTARPHATVEDLSAGVSSRLAAAVPATSAEPDAPTPVTRTRSADGARALREAASQQQDQRLATALTRLARHIDPHIDPQGPT